MNFREIIGGLFWVAISIFVCIESIKEGIGTFHSPGPGFFPFWVGVFLGIFSIIIVVSGTRKGKDRGKIIDLWKGMQWHKVLFFIITLAVYCTLFTKLGYFITTFALIGFLFGIIKRPKWWIQWGAAFLVTLLSYLIFYKLLEVPLPKGIFDFFGGG